MLYEYNLEKIQNIFLNVLDKKEGLRKTEGLGPLARDIHQAIEWDNIIQKYNCDVFRNRNIFGRNDRIYGFNVSKYENNNFRDKS